MDWSKIDKPLSLRMAILKLHDGQQDIAKNTQINGRLVKDKIWLQIARTGLTPYDVAQYANMEVEMSDEIFKLLMDSCNCRLYCAKE
ncbi:hypothetical protein [Vibrio europaeus]|uniref:Uncharacterized protein n=1 Tax=Vibrio europaeus TaxID=300876 RepID=A0ABT5GZ36_9VIBR|nr:hypothetical protein [Vibrio europaeus]MDC5708438.1 hypothetical protein [Vibrio europaeus]MDC5713100.1 hypothetical protein [Vibrio europaeus]MDC5728129.1 hypothetical protein [Vibrio europaeus]MDC5733277.1 hypothetical protein [Vibrio europaeus]MDC5742346.1 hypothetical protein [Vibrio europaeus]